MPKSEIENEKVGKRNYLKLALTSMSGYAHLYVRWFHSVQDY